MKAVYIINPPHAIQHGAGRVTRVDIMHLQAGRFYGTMEDRRQGQLKSLSFGERRSDKPEVVVAWATPNPAV